MNRPGQSLLSRLSFSRSANRQTTQSTPLAARTFLALLSNVKSGYLLLTLPDGRTEHFGIASDSLHADLHILDWDVFRDVLKHGDIGFAESYIRGEWNTTDLKAILEIAIRNRTLLEKAIYGSWFGSLLYRFRHRLRNNSKSGSRKNIHAHYDLGNPFYSLWLDPSMTYSSAWFRDDLQTPLAEAQSNKYRRILSSIDAAPGKRILEIGCGWGGFIEEAATAGCHVIGLTLSHEQKKFAQARLEQQGLISEIRFQDYRDCKEQFDGIASIEMFEAVGENHWEHYFNTIAASLKPGGKACIQTIVIAEELFERYRSSTDFIQQYVFPGGMLPSKTTFKEYASRAGLRVEDEFAFGVDYAETLCIWYEAFNRKLDEVTKLGFDEAFIRLWNFYLMYCAAGFSERNIDVVQFTLVHDHTSGDSLRP
jgi:cyclopropane-fatty-acyl-phospholipid synthase